MNMKFISILVVIFGAAMCAFGQSMPTMPTPAPSLETILSEAAKQTQNYREEFKNLLADEKKTFERYNKNGEMKGQSVVESNFLVYQSEKDKNVTSELRNVVKVDGKPIPDSQKRSDLFFAELQKTSTLERELEKIQSEGSRYDKTLEIYGLTLFEAGVLSERLRPYFDFKLLGSENYQGKEVFVVSYQQTKKSPYIMFNGKEKESDELSYKFKFDLPGSLKNADALMRGKLWIDAKTFQVWREERQVTIQSPEPLVIIETTFDYQPSDYQILVPKQIVLSSNLIRKNSKENQFAVVRDVKVSYDYSRFRKTNVDIKVLDDQ